MLEICERARAAMNLLLLFSVLLAWLIVTDVPTILDKIQALEQLLLTSKAESRPPVVQQFLKSGRVRKGAPTCEVCRSASFWQWTLMSLALSLEELSTRQPTPSVLDWLPLHAGKVAHILGAV